jgi:hypothetical protein
MNQQDRLNLMLGMRTQTDFSFLFDDGLVTGHPNKIFVCRICQNWYTFEEDLKRHLKSKLHARQIIYNNDGDDNFYYCQPCDRFFISEAMASKHDKTTKHKKKLAKKIKRDLKKSD